MRTESILHVGAQIDIPMEDGGVRRCEVVWMGDDEFCVKFFKPDGTGPFTCVLPHAELPANTVHRTLYQNEAGGPHESWWKWHPDATGKDSDWMKIVYPDTLIGK